MNNHEKQHHDDLLDRATGALRASPVPAGPPDELVARVLASLQPQEMAARPQPQSLWTRINAMKPTTKLAVAAALMAAFLGLFSWFAPNGGNRALAVEDVAKAFAAIRTAKCQTTTTGEMEGPDGKMIPISSSGNSMFLAPSRERVETTTKTVAGPIHMIMILDMRAGKAVNQLPDQKMAIVMDMTNGPEERSQGTFEPLRQLFIKAQQSPDKDVQPLPERTIKGVVAQGLRFSNQGGFQTDVWAHPETSCPVYIETTTLNEPKIKTVMTDFEYNIELDESLFSLDPPEGYTVREMTLDLSKAKVQALADTLRFCAENLDGLFPRKLRGKEGIDGCFSRAMEAKAKELEAKDWLNPSKMMDVFGSDDVSKFGQTSGFLMTLPPKGDWHYAGDGVKLGDADRAIFWYKPTGSETYEVLYGDLRIVEDVQQKDLPKLSGQ